MIVTKTQKPVRLRWIPTSQRGRKQPPAGPTYVGVVQLQTAGAADEMWSARLENLHTSEDESDAVMSFVSEHAPDGALQTGVGFQLFEGRWPVAEGTIL